jgi:hypothetical protein
MSRDRAERIARSHACVKCGEYSWKRSKVAEASAAEREALGGIWRAELQCGVCNTRQEIVITTDGDIVDG